jgi:hypothetical protein
MSFKQKNVTASLVSFSLILAYFSIRVLLMIQQGAFIPSNVFRLWVIVIVLAIVVTVFGTILAHIIFAILEAIRTRQEPEIENVEDERDTLIDLRGTKVTQLAASIGVGLGMLTYVLGQPPLVMFTLLIFFGVVAQIIGDISRLVLYRRGVARG